MPPSNPSLKLSSPSLLALRDVISGDQVSVETPPVAPYRSHARITDFFDEVEVPEHARVNTGRLQRLSEALKAMNGKPGMLRVLQVAFNPGHFTSPEQLSSALEHLNNKLKHDKLRVWIEAGEVVVSSITGVEVEPDQGDEDPLSDEHIQRLLRRAEARLQSGEYDAAITVARTLLEDTLHGIEWRLLASREQFSGDLMKLFKHVTSAMGLSDQRNDLSENAKALVRGLTMVVGALAPIANKSSDRHSPERLPAHHHARLCVNAVKTIVAFLRDSYLAQVEARMLTPRERVAPKR